MQFLPELGICLAGDLFELAGEMGRTGIVHHMGYFGQRQAFTYQLLYLFDA